LTNSKIGLLENHLKTENWNILNQEKLNINNYAQHRINFIAGF
jgi:hypothetical protein